MVSTALEGFKVFGLQTPGPTRLGGSSPIAPHDAAGGLSPGAWHEGCGEPPETTRTASLECLWGAFGGREAGREPPGDNTGDPKWASCRKGTFLFPKCPSMLKMIYRKSVHAVEARNPI